MGVIPLCAARNVEQAKEALGACDWRLSDAEIAMLDDSSNESAQYAMGFELI